MSKNIYKKIFLENLPHESSKRNRIIWSNSIGYKIYFIYDDISGYIKIIDYNKKTRLLTLEYNNYTFYILTCHLLKCKLGNMLNKYTNKFKIEIGQSFKDNKRNITIIDREYRNIKHYDKYKKKDKWYKYHCNKCGWNEGWILESELLKGTGCSCCNNRTVVRGINDIATTHPYLIKYFVNIEDTYKYTYGTHKKFMLKCPSCGFEKEMRIRDMYNQRFSCPKCSDGISYPEKLMFNLLCQLKENKLIKYFKHQLSSNILNWCDKYRYDFYFELNEEKYIIEVHGIQHYYGSFEKLSGRTLEEEQQNDLNKYNLAIQNGIKPENYIIIDCRKSELDFIKNNILNSRLNEIFDLNNVDWIEIGQASEKSLVKQVCDYWHLHNEINCENIKQKDLKKIFKISDSTISSYLKRGGKNNV